MTDSNSKNEERLLERHRQHLGLYQRVADLLSVAPSYVSLVASGKRSNERIMAALLKELRKIS
jgi:predicted transcriptional regulator